MHARMQWIDVKNFLDRVYAVSFMEQFELSKIFIGL